MSNENETTETTPAAKLEASALNNLVSRDDGLPWDIKQLKLSMGGIDDEKGFIRFEIFNDDTFNIYQGDRSEDGDEWFYEEINIEAARRLRDFLNYAVPK